MSIRCWLGWHDRGVSSHKLGQPWVFNMYCYRCGKRWTDEHWLPPQPITCDHPAEHHQQLRTPESRWTPDGIVTVEWWDCRICRDLRRFSLT